MVEQVPGGNKAPLRGQRYRAGQRSLADVATDAARREERLRPLPEGPSLVRCNGATLSPRSGGVTREDAGIATYTASTALPYEHLERAAAGLRAVHRSRPLRPE